MAENEYIEQQEPSKRQLMGARLKEKYPDKDFDDDEQLFGQIHDDYDEYDESLKGYRDREKSLVDLFNNDPRSAQFITDMARGEDPFVAMIQRVGVDGMTELINDPTKQKEFAEANKQYIDRLAREKQLEQEYQTNLRESLTMLDEMQQSGEYTEEQLDEAVNLLGDITNDAILGKFTRENVEMALKALNHDNAVAKAKSAGEIAGRNANIEEKLRRPSRENQPMPQLGGANNTSPQSHRDQNILDFASDI